jgi:hypothetical protein
MFNPGYAVPAINNSREILNASSSYASGFHSLKPARKNDVCICLSSGRAIEDEFYECELCKSTGIYPPTFRKKRLSVFERIVKYILED